MCENLADNSQRLNHRSRTPPESMLRIAACAVLPRGQTTSVGRSGLDGRSDAESRAPPVGIPDVNIPAAGHLHLLSTCGFCAGSENYRERGCPVVLPTGKNPDHPPGVARVAKRVCDRAVTPSPSSIRSPGRPIS